MNLYKYWLKVKTLYPHATADCVAWFRHSWVNDWKTHFRNPDEIVSWLEKRHIHILTRKNTRNYPPDGLPSGKGDIRFELKSPEENTITAFRFTSRETALYDAIERAFRILEQRELRRRAQNPAAFDRRRKTRPQPAAGPSWKEQLS